MSLLTDKSDGHISGWQKWLKAAYSKTLLRVHQSALSDRITEYLFRECIKTHDYRHLGLCNCFSILKTKRFFYVAVLTHNSKHFYFFNNAQMFLYIYRLTYTYIGSKYTYNLFSPAICITEKTFNCFNWFIQHFHKWFIFAPCKSSLHYSLYLRLMSHPTPICLAHLYKAPNCK